MTQQVTYLGKATKSPEDALPVPEIPQPFRVGEKRVFTDDYLTTLGVDPKQGDEWVKDTFAIQNQNRGDSPLFLVEDAPKKGGDKPPDAPPKANKPTVKTGDQAGNE